MRGRRRGLLAGVAALVPAGAEGLAEAQRPASAPPCENSPIGPFEFNQALLDRWWGGSQRDAQRGFIPPATAAHPQSPEAEARFDEPATILRAVLSMAPEDPVVYPSEQYFYYEFPLRDRLVAGNLRFTSADEGALHVGYFDRHDQRAVRAALFSASEGVMVHSEEGGGRVRVRYGDVERVFTLDRSWMRPPPGLSLLEGERRVTGVLDESGFAFSLLHHEATNALYYVLDEDRPLPDRLAPVRGSEGRLLVGVRSRFVFLEEADLDRLILIGVRRDHVRRKTYFDGPFDQIPPHLPIRSLLESVYPYVALRGGIDEHGVFRDLPGQRVAISPYQAYSDLDSLRQFLDLSLDQEQGGPALWYLLTYEEKRDFHRRLASVGPGATPRVVHALDRSAAWPANHEGGISRGWAEDHEADLSRSWPPNTPLTQPREGP